MAKRDIDREITDKLIALLDSGLDAWRKEWSTGGIDGALPYNFSTGKAYNGMNIIGLVHDRMQGGFSSNGWATFKQIKNLGGSVKGQRSVAWVVWASPIEKENGDKYFMMRTSAVFNLEQVEGVDPEKLKGFEARTVADIESPLDGAVRAAGVNLSHGGDKAYYRPSTQEVRMPHAAQFTDLVAYNSTLLHEVTHWTGHASRLDRKGGLFGDPAYAFEELVAELGSVFTCAALGLEYRLENHASYVKSWLKVLKSEPKAVRKAARMASQASDMMLDKMEHNPE